MANKKITQLPASTTPLTGAEIVPVVQSGATVQTSVNSLGPGIGYTPAGTGAVATTVQTKLRESVSVKDFGAVGNGVADDTLAFQAANTYVQSSGLTLNVPAGSYKLNTEVTPAVNNYRVNIDPSAIFTNQTFNLINGTRIIGADPTTACNLIYQKVTTAFNQYEHVVGQSIFMEGTSPNAVSVGLYSNAEVAATGHSGFGANIGTYVTAAGTGIACEIDTHVTHPSGLAYALAIDAIGTYPSEAAIVIQNNNSTAWYKFGISFNNANGTGTIASNGAAIYMNSGVVGHYIKGLASATLAEIELPSFIVGPTPVSPTGIIRIDSSASATPTISAAGSSSIISPIIKAKGNNSSVFINVDGATSFRATGLNTSTDYIKVTNGSAGATVGVDGASANSDLVLEPKGTGKLRYGAVVAQGDAAITGHVLIKDSAGNSVKLAVVT